MRDFQAAEFWDSMGLRAGFWVIRREVTMVQAESPTDFVRDKEPALAHRARFVLGCESILILCLIGEPDSMIML